MLRNINENITEIIENGKYNLRKASIIAGLTLSSFMIGSNVSTVHASSNTNQVTDITKSKQRERNSINNMKLDEYCTINKLNFDRVEKLSNILLNEDNTLNFDKYLQLDIDYRFASLVRAMNKKYNVDFDAMEAYTVWSWERYKYRMNNKEKEPHTGYFVAWGTVGLAEDFERYIVMEELGNVDPYNYFIHLDYSYSTETYNIISKIDYSKPKVGVRDEHKDLFKKICIARSLIKLDYEKNIALEKNYTQAEIDRIVKFSDELVLELVKVEQAKQANLKEGPKVKVK